MYPLLFGNELLDLWTIMVGVGIFAALLVFRQLSIPFRLTDKSFKLHGILLIVSIAFGFVSAYLFQGLYNVIAGKGGFTGVTFMGGLVGAVVIFVVLSIIFCRGTTQKQLWNTICLAPIALSLGHAFGRIGCLFAGCCHGKQSDSFLAIEMHGVKYLPTQLFEAIFLFVLFGVMLTIVLKYKKYSILPLIYLYSYSIFRFSIEFLRGDAARAVSGFLSPSQWQSVIMLIGAIILSLYMFKYKRIPLNGKVENDIAGYLFVEEK